MNNENRVFILTINGENFTIDPSGSMAITTSGKAIRLSDQDRSRYGR